MSDYPRAIAQDSKHFDPVKLALDTEDIVCKGDLRKYTNFYLDKKAYSGIATADAAGCCLRCFFCWADKSRDYPELHGEFYNPEEVLKKLIDIAEENNVKIMRLSGAEPTLCREHLFKFLSIVEETEYDFILETNGILLSDEEYVKQLSKYKKIKVRVSLKAGTPEQFAKKTGAISESFELPFLAVRNLRKYGVNFSLAAATDPRIMNLQERESLFRKLEEIDPELTENIDEEILLSYNISSERIKKSGMSNTALLIPNFFTYLLRRLPFKGVRIFIKNLLYRFIHRSN
ncbi:putative Fe-S oxidoreductase [Thaumarchaeota archaeon SCGC AB-539-E09]|nr:putative Fe-S oxidoreductase [Thaumarchaeota archaeon SCGC AB-539-E09]